MLRQDGYGLPGKQAKGTRPSGEKMIHVVSSSMTITLLKSLLKEKLNPDSFIQEQAMEVMIFTDHLGNAILVE